jgi:hypothetical protein
MINRKEAVITHLSAHFVGSEVEGKHTFYTEKGIDLSDELLHQSLLSFFTENFKEPEFFRFLPVAGSMEDNTMYQAVMACFDDDSHFHDWSIQVTKWLVSQSKHHQIKSGEVLICKIENILVEDEILEAIGIFKIENKENYLSFSENAEEDIDLNINPGINLNKTDKACLILHTEQDSGFKIFNIDHSNRNQDAKYWRDDFLKITPRSDDYHYTKEYIQLTKEFVHERLGKQFDADKSQQAQTMQRSLDYFQKEETFDHVGYATKVFKDEQIVEAFRDFKEDYENYKQIELTDEFGISDQAVKKQSRVFKSIIKLDKNFHIYVHGNKNMIQKGVDEEGRKYYVLYYDEEH